MSSSFVLSGRTILQEKKCDFEVKFSLGTDLLFGKKIKKFVNVFKNILLSAC